MVCKYTGCGVAAVAVAVVAPREGGDSCFVVAGVIKVVAAIVVVVFLLLRFGGMAFEGGIVPCFLTSMPRKPTTYTPQHTKTYIHTHTQQNRQHTSPQSPCGCRKNTTMISMMTSIFFSVAPTLANNTYQVSCPGPTELPINSIDLFPSELYITGDSIPSSSVIIFTGDSIFRASIQHLP